MRLEQAGLKSVAILEAAKGALVIATAAALFELLRVESLQQAAEQLVMHFHLNPASAYPRILTDLAANMSESRLYLLAAGALTYAGVRFVEAYGLWHCRRWAALLGIAGAGIYVPFESAELVIDPGWPAGAVLLTNLAILLVLWRSRPKSH